MRARPIALGLEDQQLLAFAVDMRDIERAQLAGAQATAVEQQDHQAIASCCGSGRGGRSHQPLGFLEGEELRPIAAGICCRLKPSSTLRSVRPLRQAYSSSPRRWLRYLARLLSVQPPCALGFEPMQVVLELQVPQRDAWTRSFEVALLARRSVQRTSMMVRGVLRPDLIEVTQVAFDQRIHRAQCRSSSCAYPLLCGVSQSLMRMERDRGAPLRIGDVHVAHRGRDDRVAEDALHLGQMNAGFQQVGRAAVPKLMQTVDRHLRAARDGVNAVADGAARETLAVRLTSSARSPQMPQSLPAGCGAAADMLRGTAAPSPATARSARCPVLRPSMRSVAFGAIECIEVQSLQLAAAQARCRTASPAPSPTGARCTRRGGSPPPATSPPCARDRSASAAGCTA